MHIAQLGRQPELGLAELNQVYGRDNVVFLKDSGFALIKAPVGSSDINRLGGSIKLAEVLVKLSTANWREIERNLSRNITKYVGTIPDGKLTIGLSAHGFNIQPHTVGATSLRLKKELKKLTSSIRVVPNKSATLNTAQVIHNHLTSPSGREFIAVKDGPKTFLAITRGEQDIESYTARDQARPARDAFVGMLPPKLAQIMINLAQPSVNARILDPFCGTGVLLQEALLMGYDVYGTDLSDKMIDYSGRNLKWLHETFLTKDTYKLEQGDAMNATWSQPIDAVVCETYLGQPFSAPPSAAKLEEVRGNCNHIVSEFLRNIGSQVKPGTPLCIGIPAWRSTSGDFTHLPLISELKKLGYTQVRVSRDNLLYFRPDQVVAREILVLQKI